MELFVPSFEGTRKRSTRPAMRVLTAGTGRAWIHVLMPARPLSRRPVTPDTPFILLILGTIRLLSYFSNKSVAILEKFRIRRLVRVFLNLQARIKTKKWFSELAWRVTWGLVNPGLLIIASSYAYALPFTILDSAAPPAGSGEIFLTFDDGPHPQMTPQILAVLRETNTPATFFFIGSKVAAHPELASAAELAGHEIAAHGWAGNWPVFWGVGAALSDIGKTRDAINLATGKDMATPILFRPPRGLVSPAISALQKDCLIRLGHITFYADDASALPSASHEVLEALKTGVTRHHGAAIVLHSSRYRADPDLDDLTDKSWLPATLQRFIEWAKLSGYRFAIHPGLTGTNC